jgi:glycogen operon protein
MTRDVDHGSSFPLGATDVGDGVNFSVYSKNASRVDVLLFDTVDAAKPARVVSLDRRQHRTYHYWHAWVRGLRAGQIYGYRVYGPFAPAQGMRFDPQKLLLDPYGTRTPRP